MTMEDRLNAISISKPAGEKEPPRADTLATLLSQGLFSQDQTIIDVSSQYYFYCSFR